MNLFDMLRRRDRNLLVSGRVEMAKGLIHGEPWRGLHLSPGASIRITDPLRFYSLRAWPDTCGWYASLPADGPDLQVSFVRSGTNDVSSLWTIAAGAEGPVPVRLPWPAEKSDPLDLIVSAVPRNGSCLSDIFLANHRALSRKLLLDAAKGVGVEIGPGPQPQIFPSNDVTVSYVEQMPPDEWNRLYNVAGKFPVRPELWGNYIVGNASDIPCEDESLDFIFGSHVFEHLANPVGHLERWRRKLRPSGKILCVIPDLGGSKDALQRPSILAEWQEEYDRGIWEPLPTHYVRHMRRDMDDPIVQSAIADRQSIHAHYYTNTNCEQLLSYARELLGFSSFSITWTPNHKDFYFTLVK
jgi:SAM-dependent methyltransferase